MCLSSRLGLSNSFPHVSHGSSLLDLDCDDRNGELLFFTVADCKEDCRGNEKSIGLGMTTLASDWSDRVT